MRLFGSRSSPGKVVLLRRLSGAAGELTDEALVAACAVNDGAALGALFDRYSRALYRFASRLLGTTNDVDVEDVVSATFLEACRSAHAYRGGSSVRTWLFGIAVNVVRHQVRGDLRRRIFLREYEQIPVANDVDRPDDAAARHQLLTKVEATLRALPDHLRVAFLMCDVEEISCSEAARALGLRQGTVWKRVRRAREILGETLR